MPTDEQVSFITSVQSNPPTIDLAELLAKLDAKLDEDVAGLVAKIDDFNARRGIHRSHGRRARSGPDRPDRRGCLPPRDRTSDDRQAHEGDYGADQSRSTTAGPCRCGWSSAWFLHVGPCMLDAGLEHAQTSSSGYGTTATGGVP